MNILNDHSDLGSRPPLGNALKNFFAGPGKMPVSVLQRIQAELLDFQGTGLSVMEWGHRSAPILELLERVQMKLRRLLALPSSSEVLLLQGGGTMQFYMVPMNLSQVHDPVDYVDTGYWTRKAIDSCRSLGRDIHIAAESEFGIPTKLDVREQAKYLHLCTNNTVIGTQWKTPPAVGSLLVADMSSDILSGAQDISRYDLIYAQAQKTIGTAGVTVVILNERARESIVDDIPPFFDYRVHAAAKSNFHTPPVFSIYVVDCMLDWIESDIGGPERLGVINQQKAALLYEVIDRSTIFVSPVDKDARSLMNIVFDIHDPALAKRFSEQAAANQFLGIDGHRSRGGFRASLYNAVTLDDVRSLADFMRTFENTA